MKPSSPSTLSAAQTRRRQRKQRKESERVEQSNFEASLAHATPYLAESDTEIKSTPLCDHRLDEFAEKIWRRLDRIEVMLKSKAVQIVMDLSDSETLLAKQALETDVMEADTDNMNKYEPEEEKSPIKITDSAATNESTVAPTCLYFDLATDDTMSNAGGSTIGDRGQGKGSGEQISNLPPAQCDSRGDADAVTEPVQIIDTCSNGLAELLEEGTWAAARAWDKSQWLQADVRQIAFSDSILGITYTEFPASMPLFSLMARYCFKKELDLRHVVFSMWGETLSPEDTWNMLRSKHGIDNNNMIDVTRLTQMS